jgi:predicted ATPase/DNA-binding SARP family transcriptional activator
VSAFRVLGPVEAWADQRPLVLGGPRQVALLAFLLLHANRAVSADAVIDAVWGEERDGAPKRLQMAVSRLRRALEPLDRPDGPRIRTVGGGYLLSLAPGELDAELFAERVRDGRRTLEQGDTAGARELLNQALALWRGPPLGDIGFEEFAQPEIRRLEELRLVALETRIDADLELGRHADVIGELEGLVAREPARERLTGQLMTALYRSGRQTEALEVYQRTRATLAEELGLEPGPVLKALQSQILDQDSSLDRHAAPTVGRSNLPTPSTALVGRGDEISRALELLADGEVRLLTLWGPGGSGKTRLALEVAAELVHRYRDGVWVVPLAPIPDRAVMVAEVSRVLEVPPVAGEPSEQALVRALAGRELLLVLDNFEHLLDAGAVVADVLASSPRVAVLSTSREPLRIRGEHRMEVPPLPPGDAAELFLDRARAVRPDLEVDQNERAAIERICERLDRLPLALELAAARVAVFGPRQLETRLAERLALPEGPRDLPERQRTLRATIAWSYQLLSSGERDLLARLSPFIGGIRIDSAESIWGPEAVESLISLAEKSLLRRRNDPDGEIRLWMLELVRAFALERAADDGIAEEAATEHATHFLALAEQAAPYLHGADEVRWLDRLESDNANLRAALDHLCAQAPAESLRLAGALTWFWEIRGYRIEARRRMNQVLAVAPPDDPARGMALVVAGRLAQRMGDVEQAKPLLLEGLPIVQRLGDHRLAALALGALGWCEEIVGNEASIAERYEQAIATARDAGDEWVLAVVLNGYSSCGSVRGNPGQARPLVEEALALFRRIGDVAGIAVTATTVAEIAMDAGDLDVADEVINEALEQAGEIGFRPVIAYALLDRAIVSLLRDRFEDADTDLRDSIRMSVADGDAEMAADTLSAAATVAAMRHIPTRAAMLWGAAGARRGAAEEHAAIARLRTKWEPLARAQADDEAGWEAATRAGGTLPPADALALASG